MALFRRSESRASKAEEPVETTGSSGEEAPAEAAAPARGPFDASQVEGPAGRVDLGSIWLPGVRGMELRMEMDKKTQKITGVACSAAGSALQVQAFAAPRSEGIWDEIREEIAQSVTKQGGSVDDLPGPFGRELFARLPATAPDGRQGVRPARFIGVDGPRWFLRGVLTGKAATDPAEAKLLETVFANIVVVRDQSPRPPRDLLALHLPGKAPRPGAPAPEGTQPAAPTFDPLTRGPEITEIR